MWSEREKYAGFCGIVDVAFTAVEAWQSICGRGGAHPGQDRVRREQPAPLDSQGGRLAAELR